MVALENRLIIDARLFHLIVSLKKRASQFYVGIPYYELMIKKIANVYRITRSRIAFRAALACKHDKNRDSNETK